MSGVVCCARARAERVRRTKLQWSEERVWINGLADDMFGGAQHSMVKSDNFLVILKRPLVIINWSLSVQWSV